jgi:hypothetical protein
MRRNDKGWEFDELPEPFFKDEPDDSAAQAVEMRNRLVKLEQQVLSQYTSMAAYAMIAKNDTETARAESRADLDRSQATLIGLLEKLRSEVNVRLDAIECREVSGDLSEAGAARVVRLEQAVEAATEALQRCLRENNELRAQVNELMDRHMNEQGWLVSSGGAQSLSLH